MSWNQYRLLFLPSEESLIIPHIRTFDTVFKPGRANARHLVYNQRNSFSFVTAFSQHWTFVKYTSALKLTFYAYSASHFEYYQDCFYSTSPHRKKNPSKRRNVVLGHNKRLVFCFVFYNYLLLFAFALSFLYLI